MKSWAVLFDWDGVVIDSSALHRKSWEIVADKYDLPLPKGHFEKGFGKRNETIIPDILGWSKDPDHIAKLAQIKESTYRLLIKNEGIQPLPGVHTFLDWLDNQGVNSVIASSTPKENLLTALPILGLQNRFIGLISGDDVSHGKPHPEPFLKAAMIAGVDPSDCVVLEDSHSGIQAGLAAGCRVIAVATTHPLDSFDGVDDRVIDLECLDFEKIKSWFV